MRRKAKEIGNWRSEPGWEHGELQAQLMTGTLRNHTTSWNCADRALQFVQVKKGKFVTPKRVIDGELDKKHWFPLYAADIMADECWNWKDYQFGWYLKLIIRATQSSPVGYVLMDSNLWKLAGAHSKQFFEKESAVVVGRFEVAEIEGRSYLFSEKLLDVLRLHSSRSEAGEKGAKVRWQTSDSVSENVLTKKVQMPKNLEDLKEIEAACIICLELFLNGTEPRLIMEAAIKTYRRKFPTHTIQFASEELQRLWREYEGLTIPYKCGWKKFFSESIFLKPEQWEKQAKEGKFADLKKYHADENPE